MKQVLRDIIEDQKVFLRRENTVERAFPERLLHNGLVVVISGVRRCGKSVLLQQIRGRMPSSDCFLNFDDDRLANFRQQHFQDLYEVFIEMYGEQDCFFFDEIQNVEGWEHFVKRLYNMGKKVFVTGSNARMLSRELGTLLTGCYIAYELFPFSFAESLTLSGEQRLLTSRDGSRNKSVLQSRFHEYLYRGGMPMYLSTGDPQVLKTMYDNILYRDVLVRNQINNERELKEMVYFLMSNIGKPVTYSSLAGVIGVKNPSTAKAYMEFVENTYLLFTLSKMDVSVKAQLRNPKKVYCIDNAVAMSLGFRFSKDEGRMLENLVLVELKRRGKEVFYHNDGSNECDFVVRDGFVVSEAVQVCYDLGNPLTRERELKGLLSAMQAYGLDEGLLLTDSQQETVEKDGRRIRIVPAWEWLVGEGER